MIGGCIFPGVKEALLIGQYLIIPFMLFGGMFVNIDSFPRAFVWYVYISVTYKQPFHYAFEGMTVNEYTDQNLKCQCDPIKDLGHERDMLAWDIVILICMAVFYKAVAFGTIHYKSTRYLS